MQAVGLEAVLHLYTVCVAAPVRESRIGPNAEAAVVDIFNAQSVKIIRSSAPKKIEPSVGGASRQALDPRDVIGDVQLCQ